MQHSRAGDRMCSISCPCCIITALGGWQCAIAAPAAELVVVIEVAFSSRVGELPLQVTC